MLLTILTKFPRSRRTNGRYLLAPIAWVVFGMLALSRVVSPTAPVLTMTMPHPAVDQADIADEPTVAPEDPIVDTAVTVPPASTTVQPRKPRRISRGALFSDLRQPLNLNDWRISTHTNEHAGAFYGGPWVSENIIPQHDRLVLKVVAGKNGERPTMAEMQSNRKYGYGRYEVIMRPSDARGVVSAFFTYTGPATGDPHDEVDIEFAGNRSQAVEYNYWNNKRKGAFSREGLDFDFSERMNLYAFEWHPDEIIWYVNGEEHYRSPRDRSRIPSNPGNIFISAWTGIPATYEWTSAPDFEDSTQSEFACVSFTPFEDASYSCADLFAEDDQFQADQSDLSAD